MPEITITVPDGLREKMEAAWPGTTLEQHLQSRVDGICAHWETEAPAVVKREMLDQYDRLAKPKQNQVKALLDSAPKPIEEEEIEALPK